MLFNPTKHILEIDTMIDQENKNQTSIESNTQSFYIIDQDSLSQLQNLTRDAILSRFEELHDINSIQGLESLLSGKWQN